jgi:hypothetical protein
MRVNQTSPSSETPPTVPSPPPPPSKRYRKRTYVALGIVAVAAVASALVFLFLTSPHITLNIVAVTGGTVSPNGATTLTVGQSHSFRATADSGYQFDHWDLNGTNVGTANPSSLMITSSMNGQTLTAIFTAIIPLSYNYIPGEEMTYNITSTVTTGTGQNMSTPETIRIDVLSFDGENYTINETSTVQMPSGSPIIIVVTELVNKTGYATYLNGSAGTQQLSSMFSNFGYQFQKDQARVGDVWQVPVKWGNSSYGSSGTLTYKFYGIQNITVPAGTYQVFRMDVSGSNLTLTMNTATMLLTMNTTVKGQMYMEYGTCRLVYSEFQENISILQGGLTSTETVSMEMKLVEHVKP